MAEYMPCPCHNCPDRWVNPDTLETCRPTCERWEKWQEQEQERKAKIKAEEKAHQRIVDHFMTFRRKREKRGYK